MTDAAVQGNRSIGRSIWLLVHHHEDRDLPNGVDDKFVGFFPTPELAAEARRKLVGVSGFHDFPEGFEILEVPVDSPLPAPGIRLQY